MTFYVTEGGSGMLDPVAMGTAIQADLAEVGFDVTIETYEWNTFLGEVNPGPRRQGRHGADGVDDERSRHSALFSRSGPRPCLTRAASTRATTRTRRWTPFWREARTAADQDRRAELYREMQAIVQEDAPLGLRRELEAERGDERPGREFLAGAVVPPDARGRDQGVTGFAPAAPGRPAGGRFPAPPDPPRGYFPARKNGGCGLRRGMPVRRGRRDIGPQAVPGDP